MAFINEHISENDVKRTGIYDVARKLTGPISDSWTIDKERDIYLHIASRGGEEYRNHSTWLFYWKSDFIVVRLEFIDGEGKRGEPGWGHWKLRGLEIPESINKFRDEILIDFKDALVAYKDFGVNSVTTAFSVTLDIN